MRRIHALEMMDQSWCPSFVRDAATDYLQFMTVKTNPYRAGLERLKQVLKAPGNDRVVDLCAGGGGPWAVLKPELDEALGSSVKVLLTDRFPNAQAAESFGQAPDVTFHPSPVDALDVPEHLTGMRTLFAAFHHFRPDEARRILQDAVQKRRGIAVFEATERTPAAVVLMCLVPLIVLLVTPAIRPFRWSRLFFTYLIPLIPLTIWFDGVVSCLRTYSPAELRAMVDELGEVGYVWHVGADRLDGSPIAVTHLVGYPKSDVAPAVPG